MTPARAEKGADVALGSPALGIARLTAYLLWILLLTPVQALAVALRLRLRKRLPMIFHRVCLRIFDIQVTVVGQVAPEKPTLFVSNHVSYLDIEVLGSLIQGSFVAKSEVEGWPLFGWLARLQETVFINRKNKREAARQGETLIGRLIDGDNLILFPEGTSSDGNRVLPFKTALFAVAAQRIDDRPLTIQPVSLTPVALDGIPLGRLLRPLYAWYGDMSLGPHLWQFAKLGGITVVVEFHPPVTVELAGSRKALAEQCWQAVHHGVARAVGGRMPVASATPGRSATD
ncbi:MAG: lysophospholipid acyltransferase family protein [Rhodospirillaceae bacterium]